MPDECRIDVRNQGADIELEVSAKIFPNPKVYARPALDVTPAEFDKLRAGTATLAVVNDVTARISKWLQHPDLHPELDLPTILGLGAAEERLSRVVFNLSTLRDEKLRYEFGDFPIEMAIPKGVRLALSLNRRVSSIVHQLDKVGYPPAPLVTGWPFKVLIVRASPTDLPAVPPAGPIAEEIRALRPDLCGANNLQIDILSSEAGVQSAGAPLKDILDNQLGEGYHVLAFLCHGQIQEIPGTSVPTGQLQLEDSQRLSDPLEADKLASMLDDRPVPVVLLIGCLTAADLTEDQRSLVETELPKWLRGSQGVAQTLINSTSGVQCAVGMRYRIDSGDATLFLRDFFRSLLVVPPGGAASGLGNIDQAVNSARRALYRSGKQRLSFAAPVVFRTLGAEPMFPFLPSPPTQIEIEKEDQATRANIWGALAEINWSLRRPGPGGLHNRVVTMLQSLEGGIFDDVHPRAAIIMPERQEVDPGLFEPGTASMKVDVPVLLHKTISVRQLGGTIVEAARNARITKVILIPAIAAMGFELLLGPLNLSLLKFLLRHSDRKIRDLPEGRLFTLQLEISSEIKTVYQLSIEALYAKPTVPLCAPANAVIVPAP
jgi:hypothetical protein